MRNLVKVVLGSALGAGIGVAVAKVAGRFSTDSATAEFPADDQSRETFKERLARARESGDVARAIKEAELTAYFRRKVNDPSALAESPKP